MKDRLRVLLIEDSHAHFGSHSGYGNVFRHLESSTEVEILRPYATNTLKRKFIARSLRKDYNTKTYGPHHHFDKYMLEYEAFQQVDSLKPDIIHFPFAEDSLGFFADNKNKLPSHIKLVGSIHQPPSWWDMTKKNPLVLSCLDALIVLSKEAKDYFEKFLPGKVHFVPHAVDTHFFKPGDIPAIPNNPIQCLFVGNWLRDFNHFVQGIEWSKASGLNIIVNVVYHQIPEQNHPLFQLLKIKGVVWHRNISDIELRGLYQTADMLYLPLIDSTANNALLEAAACGTPIITNNCGGLLDYFGADTVHLIREGSQEEHLRLMSNCVDEPRRTETLVNARKLAMNVRDNLGVPNIAIKITSLYRSL